MRNLASYILTPFTLVLVLVLCVLPASAQELPESFSGSIVDAGGAVPGRSSAFFKIHVDEYTTDAELEALAKTLAEDGPDALRRALEKHDVGYIRVGTRLGYPLSIARVYETDEGRVLRFATDRPVAMFEAVNMARSMDYPFGMIELRLDKEGKGDGRLIVAAELSFDDDGKLSIESYGLEPFRILRARVDKPKNKKKKK